MSTSKAFELLHMDLFRPTQYTSIGGNKYGFVIVDDYTRYTWVFFLVDKSDVFATFKSFVKGIHNDFETTIKRVRSDNGSEFKNTNEHCWCFLNWTCKFIRLPRCSRKMMVASKRLEGFILVQAKALRLVSKMIECMFLA